MPKVNVAVVEDEAIVARRLIRLVGVVECCRDADCFGMLPLFQQKPC